MSEKETDICQICNKEKNLYELIPAKSVRRSIVETIKKEFPAWDENGFICINDLNHFRKEHMEVTLEIEKGELTKLDEEVVRSLKQEELLSKNINNEYTNDLSLGQIIADRVAKFGGSWRFIISFIAVLLLWITANTFFLLRKAFDPYPFILLNLVLSCVAAIQAPIIMMSQNRQEEKDRLRSEQDYQINLKAEIEIRTLKEKIDYMSKEWLKLMETQQIQTEMIEELLSIHKERHID